MIYYIKMCIRHKIEQFSIEYHETNTKPINYQLDYLPNLKL